MQKSKPVLDAFWAWIQSSDTMKNFAVTKATGYATGQKACLENFLLERLPMLGVGVSVEGLEVLASWSKEAQAVCRVVI